MSDTPGVQLRSSDSPQLSVTFVCCVEAGMLEALSLRMVQSLRRFGGVFADAPVLAVTPRAGLRLTRNTREQFDQLGAQHVHVKRYDAYTWYHFLNKPYCLIEAQRRVDTDLIVFLDSDVLVLREPTELMLTDAEDFTAIPEAASVASTGPDDQQDHWWAAVCDAIDIKLDDLPWVTVQPANKRTRFYFNSGVFTYRRDKPVGEMYLKLIEQMLAARIACPHSGIHWFEQAALGLAALKCGLRHRELDLSHNHNITGWGERNLTAQALRDVRLLHYHNAMEPDAFDYLINLLDTHHPQVRDWLQTLGPAVAPQSTVARFARPAIRYLHAMRRKRFLKTCKLMYEPASNV